MRLTLGALLVVVAVTGAALVGCSGGSSEPETLGVVNVRCPLTGKEIIPDGVPRDYVVEFEGKYYGLAPDANRADWNALSDDQKREKAAASVAPQR